MARPLRSRRAPSTTTLLCITIQRRPRGFGRACSRRRAQRGRHNGKSIRLRSSGRPLPPFFLFMEKHRRQLQPSSPNMSMVQVAKRLGRMWHRLPKREKDMYRDTASHLRGRRRRALRSRTKSLRRTLGNITVSITTKAASLRNFLIIYL